MRGNHPAFFALRNGKEVKWTWTEYYENVIKFAKSAHYLGIEDRKGINIMGWNSPEWVFAFYGGMFNNNIVTGVYATNSPPACLYQAQNSEA